MQGVILTVRRVHGPVLLKSPQENFQSSSIFLNNLEQKMCFHMRGLFIYRVSTPATTSNIFQRFREALSQVLVPYYFMAGRIRVDEEQRRIELCSNNEGVLFAGAECESHSISELDDLRNPSHEYRKFLVYPDVLNDLSQVPLLTIQVTKFRCGGFVLGISTNHAVFDGVSLKQFLRVLSNLVQGFSLSKICIPKVNVDHTLLKEKCPTSAKIQHPEMLLLPDIPARFRFKPSSFQSTISPGIRHVYQTFSFTPEMLQALKSQALRDGSISKCSTFEALAAHIWRSRVQAISSTESGTEQYDDLDRNNCAKLFIMVNLRTRLPKQVAADFIGNCAFAAPCIDTTVKQIVEEPLSFCVRQVQETINKINKEFVLSTLDYLEGNYGSVNHAGGMVLTQWSSAGFETLDFGWGSPSYVTSVSNDVHGIVGILSNCKGDGGLDIWMAAEPQQMITLEKFIMNMGLSCRL